MNNELPKEQLSLQGMIEYLAGACDPEAEARVRARLQDPDSRESGMAHEIAVAGRSAFRPELLEAAYSLLDHSGDVSEGVIADGSVDSPPGKLGVADVFDAFYPALPLLGDPGRGKELDALVCAAIGRLHREAVLPGHEPQEGGFLIERLIDELCGPVFEGLDRSKRLAFYLAVGKELLVVGQKGASTLPIAQGDRGTTPASPATPRGPADIGRLEPREEQVYYLVEGTGLTADAVAELLDVPRREVEKRLRLVHIQLGW
jgi:hypothetical protein